MPHQPEVPAVLWLVPVLCRLVCVGDPKKDQEILGAVRTDLRMVGDPVPPVDLPHSHPGFLSISGCY